MRLICIAEEAKDKDSLGILAKTNGTSVHHKVCDDHRDTEAPNVKCMLYHFNICFHLGLNDFSITFSTFKLLSVLGPSSSSSHTIVQSLKSTSLNSPLRPLPTELQERQVGI